MTWLADLAPQPETRGPLTLQSFVCELLPPLLCYYAFAVLVILPDTFTIRLALLPLTLWSNYRAATRLDLALGYDEPGLVYLNQGLLLALTVLAMRAITWTFRWKPLKRLSPRSKVVQPGEDIPEKTPIDLKQVLIDACDLFFNQRGCGWDWSYGLQIPAETRSTSSVSSFIGSTAFSFMTHIIAFDIFHYSVQSFSPSTIGSTAGGSIYDPTLPPVPRYLRSTTITLLSGLTVYCAIQVCYHLLTIIGVLLFRQHPTQWPPVFNSPWLSTSVTDFWAKRWHQLFRDNFISVGAKPLSLLVGRVGGVLGAFLISGVLHDLGLWGMGNGSDPRSVVGYFIAMGVGIIVESFWKKFTGQRVSGIVGWIWTAIWILGWGNIIVDAWARKGLIGSVFFPDSLRISKHLFGSL